MNECYPLFFNDCIIGKVTIARQGLFYQIDAKFKSSQKNIYRLEVRCDHNNINLGVFIPEEDTFTLRTKRPAKIFGEGVQRFCAVINYETGTFYPAFEDRPFAHIGSLGRLRYCLRNNQPGVLLTEQAPIQPDSDQNP